MDEQCTQVPDRDDLERVERQELSPHRSFAREERLEVPPRKMERVAEREEERDSR
jgi:hypothetical protein